MAIVNEALARRMGGGAVGRSLRGSRDASPLRIVGVVREVTYNGITEASQPFVYLPLAQNFRSGMYVLFRTADRNGLGLLRDSVRALDPGVAVSDFHPMTAQVVAARAVPRTSALISASAAGLALFLAVVGLYGVLMTSVDERAREFAIRTALGATPAEIVRRTAQEGALVVAAGLIAGFCGSMASGRLVGALLYGVGSHDPLVAIAVPAVLVFASALAWLMPARRAATVDPATLLRST